MSIAMCAQDPCRPRPQPRPDTGSMTDTDRHFGVAIHLTPLAAFVFGPLILAPLVLWLIRKDQSAFNDDHGREMTNALLSFLLYHLVAIITVIGIIALPVLYVIGIINLIRGAMAAGRGEYFRYPMTVRFIS